MSDYEIRILKLEDARSFLANMRWFTGFGRITARKIDDDHVRVRATRAAWSQWVEPK